MLDTLSAIFQLLKFLLITIPFIAIFMIVTQFNWAYILKFVGTLGGGVLAILAVVIFFSFLDLVDN